VLYIVCFSLYVAFSRQPDYFDSEFTEGTIVFKKNSTGATVADATFTLYGKQFYVDASYLFRRYNSNEKVPIIYEFGQPQHAAVYSFWGYWLRWQELLASIGLLFVLYQAAVSITNNPSPEGLISEIEGNKPRKRKYN